MSQTLELHLMGVPAAVQRIEIGGMFDAHHDGSPSMTNWLCRFVSADYCVQPSCLFHANSWTTYMTTEVMAASPAVWPAVAM
jgi:hypothetical protein